MEKFTAHTLAVKKVRQVGNNTVLQVDTKDARYFDIPWRELGAFGKRKFENLVFMSHMKDNPKIIYKEYA